MKNMEKLILKAKIKSIMYVEKVGAECFNPNTHASKKLNRTLAKQQYMSVHN